MSKKSNIKPMTPKQLLDANLISEEQFHGMIAVEKEAEEESKAQKFFEELENSNLATIKAKIKKQAVLLNVQAALSESRFEKKSKERRASALAYAGRRAGGLTFD
jgi:hypothetical protein